VNKVFFGDCRDSLRQLAGEGVKAQMCVTSPPYFGLRDYGHEGQLGLEDTPEQYVANMVEVFRAVRDVLADDGTLWVNMGDSYNSGTTKPSGPSKHADVGGWTTRSGDAAGARRVSDPTCKVKDLMGIPWMLAFALRADGWYLRQDIIWHKPNPMPESVTDRCTKAHEYLFLLSKSERYFYDHAAIKEAAVKGAAGSSFNSGKTSEHQLGRSSGKERADSDDRNKRSVWTVPTQPYSGAHFAVFPPALIEPCILAGSRPGDIVLDPFFGSGTTGEVAMKFGRQYIGCELNPAYEPLQKARTRQPALIFEESK
jgi:DNA modification methylase